jgi:hypothetical protein
MKIETLHPIITFDLSTEEIQILENILNEKLI